VAWTRRGFGSALGKMQGRKQGKPHHTEKKCSAVTEERPLHKPPLSSASYAVKIYEREN